MNAFKSNIYKYLGGTCQYLIPLYQRTYSWGQEQCVRLWSDIVNLHNTRREGHFVGSIVRIDEDSAAGSTLAMIIDGQQRLTTLTLLLIALRDYARDADFVRGSAKKLLLEDGTEKYMLSKAGSFGDETVLWDMGRLFAECK